MNKMQTILRYPVVVVLGATGAGKSKLALELGVRFSGEIISADSMQVYKGLNIITNKVTAEEQELCPHHALGMVHPLQRFTVVDFRDRVIPIIDGLLNRGKMPIIVGGTNYYIEALLWKVLLADEGKSSQQLLFETKGEVDSLRIKRKKVSEGSFSNLCKKDSHNESISSPSEPKTCHGGVKADQSKVRKQDHKADDQSKNSTTNQSRKSVPYNMSETGRPPIGLDHTVAEAEEACERTNISNSATSSSDWERTGDTKQQIQDAENSTLSGGSGEDDDFEEVDVQVRNTESSELHQLLAKVDPQMARILHPNDRRKVIRSLQVYEQHGIPQSELLKEQREQEGGSHLGGPLRYQDACVFWVQTDQTVLDTRLNKRVDEMMTAGLVKELEDFHKDYNEQRLTGQINEEELYTHGIFQSIGFKEFHPYLILAEEEKRGEEGERLLREGVDKLKTATRQYARRQLKWIKNRFLKRGNNSPAVYCLNSTNPEDWDKNVLDPAVKTLEALLQGKDPPLVPLPCEEPEVNDLSQTFVCDVCGGRQFVGHQQWAAHLQSRRHHKRARKRKLRELMGHEETQLQTPAISDDVAATK